MSLGVRGSNPIWAEFDLSGKIFDDTFYMWVLENQIPYIPATVYHDPDLNTPWNNPIRFLSNGTLPNDIYFESGVVYRLEFRQSDGINAPTQQDPLIYLVENYIGGEGGSTPVTSVAFSSSNQVSNPQFALVNFETPYTFTGTDPAPIQVGPDWYLELAGTGSVTLTQVPLTSANSNPSNAPYALELTLSGWTADSVFLRQRFYQNGLLWANQIVSTAITARVEGLNVTISASLVDSEANLVADLLSTTVDSFFNEYTDYAQLGDSVDTNTPPAAYIDYKLALPSNCDIYVTSIQLVVQDLPVKPSFEQDSINRQIDHTFHYYKPLLEFKPIKSYLVGWDFPLNPTQFGAANSVGSTGANTSAYVWDQTIAFQSVNNSIASSRSSAGNLVLTASAITQTALIQYIPAPLAQKLLLNNLSVNAILATTAPINCTISLWYTTSTLPNIASGTNLSLVTGLDSTGFPTVVAGWTQVGRVNAQNAKFTTTTSLSGLQSVASHGFSGWNALAGSVASTATYVAIVVGFGSMANAATVECSSISLVPGDIPTIPAPQTKDEVLRDCMYYYEKSYPLSVAVGEPSEDNAVVIQQPTQAGGGGGSFTVTYPGYFGFTFKGHKHSATPVLTFYAVNGTINDVTAHVSSNAAGDTVASVGISNWTQLALSDNAVSYIPATTTAIATTAIAGVTFQKGAIEFQYTVDARLGIA